MSRPRYQPKPEASESIAYDTSLPVHLPVANYYRQSTMAQVGNVSTDIQTIDMAAYLRRLGWAEDKIIQIDMDAGVSGTTKIDERVGMSHLFRLITTGKVGAVSCQDEDRLFRDVTQIQVNIFIEACRANSVLVITPSMVYNFHHEQMGTFHARQFRFKAEMAAEYITAIIRGKLHRAKRRVLMNGRWAGQPMPVGFMADMRKELPGGAPNPGWRKYVPFEPYAEVVREYWRLFLQHGGQSRPTIRHILEHGPYYPAPGSCNPPEGFKAVYRMRQYKGQWCPSRTGLKGMLTNAIYLGHWMVNGEIVIENNHPALIAPERFMQAFHYLSDRNLDGLPNTHYAPIHVYAPVSKEEERDGAFPLCAGLIFSQDTDGAWLRAGSRWSKSNNHYAYEFWSKVEDCSVWFKKAAFVDAAICGVLMEKLQATFDFDAWEQAAEGLTARFEEEKSLKESQLKQLRTVMENLITSLGTLQHPQMIQAAEKRYADAEAEAVRLRQELVEQEAEGLQISQIRMLRDTYGTMAEDWQEMKQDEQRQVLHTFISRVEASPTLGNALTLLIRWKDGSDSVAEVANQAGAFLAWTDEEDASLIRLFGQGALQLEIASALPSRSWCGIEQRYYQLVKAEDRVKVRRKRLIKDKETYLDYRMRVAEKSIANTEVDVRPKKARPGAPC